MDTNAIATEAYAALKARIAGELKNWEATALDRALLCVRYRAVWEAEHGEVRRVRIPCDATRGTPRSPARAHPRRARSG